MAEGPWRVRDRQPAAWLGAIILLAASAAVRCTTCPEDKQALLDFKSGLASDEVLSHVWFLFLVAAVGICSAPITVVVEVLANLHQSLYEHSQGLLASWNASSDPCGSQWAFVSCNCSEVYPPLNATEFLAATADAGCQRVLVLEIGPAVRTQGYQLGGNMSSSLGNLTELRTLDLHGNNLQVLCNTESTTKEILIRLHSHPFHCSVQAHQRACFLANIHINESSAG